MDPKIPTTVLALAARAKMHPIAWQETEEGMTIVFQEGPKNKFTWKEIEELVAQLRSAMHGERQVVPPPPPPALANATPRRPRKKG